MRDKTVKKYEEVLKIYSGLENKEPIEAYNELHDKELSLSYIKMIMSALKWKTNNEKYSEIIHSIIKEMENTKELFTNKFNKIDWNKLTIDEKKTDVDTVIKSLYVLFPPRRVVDYARMVYVEKEPEKNDETKNYYVSFSNEFIFQNYKTFGNYGVQRFTVPKKLQDIIMGYVKENKINDGSPLMKYRQGKGDFSEQTLSRHIKKIFGTSVDGLRHSYITFMYKDVSNLYNIEETSKKMAHNIGTHIKYLDKDNKS